MSGTPNADAEGVVSRVKVKKEIKTIVENLENILGDLKDVAKELKEVVHDIDTLTCDLQLEEDGLTDSSKTDTLNSSSSSTTTTTTVSSMERLKLGPDDCVFFRALNAPPAVAAVVAPAPLHPLLTVLKKSHPPLPPPRHAAPPHRSEEHGVMKSLPHPTLMLSGNHSKSNGALRNGGGAFPVIRSSRELFSTPRHCISNDSGVSEAGLVPTLPRPMPLLRHQKNKCPGTSSGREPRERERVRFSEKVQYHGYCPDCDLQYVVDDADRHALLQADAGNSCGIGGRLSPVHCCSASSPLLAGLPHELTMENDGLAMCHGFPAMADAPPPSVPPPPPLQHSHKPQKTILRKSTTTTV